MSFLLLRETQTGRITGEKQRLRTIARYPILNISTVSTDDFDFGRQTSKNTRRLSGFSIEVNLLRCVGGYLAGWRLSTGFLLGVLFGGNSFSLLFCRDLLCLVFCSEPLCLFFYGDSFSFFFSGNPLCFV